LFSNSWLCLPVRIIAWIIYDLLFAVVHISRFYRFFFIGFGRFIHKCKLGPYIASFIWDLFAERLVWDVVVHVGLLQSCRSPSLAAPTSP
jgi:hypothetical protein